jgi:hypothetical protein
VTVTSSENGTGHTPLAACSAQQQIQLLVELHTMKMSRNTGQLSNEAVREHDETHILSRPTAPAAELELSHLTASTRNHDVKSQRKRDDGEDGIGRRRIVPYSSP